MGRNTTLRMGSALLAAVDFVVRLCRYRARHQDLPSTSTTKRFLPSMSASPGPMRWWSFVTRRSSHVDALPAYYRSFEQHAIGGPLELDNRLRQDTDRIAQSIISKSNYFAMSLYREFRDELPAHSVLLSPHIIELDDDENKLTSRPLLASEEIPSVVTIDFNVYSFPDPREMMNSEPLTFGDIVTPLFVVHSNRWLRPSDQRLAAVQPAAARFSLEPVRAIRRKAGAEPAGRFGVRVPQAAGFCFIPPARARKRARSAPEERRPVAA